jgi:hypothetical protein
VPLRKTTKAPHPFPIATRRESGGGHCCAMIELNISNLREGLSRVKPPSPPPLLTQAGRSSGYRRPIFRSIPSLLLPPGAWHLTRGSGRIVAG